MLSAEWIKVGILYCIDKQALSVLWAKWKTKLNALCLHHLCRQVTRCKYRRENCNKFLIGKNLKIMNA